MHIKRLEIQDFNCFEHLVLDNLGNRVVLVGPNGCGKSSVLHAIAALKEFIGTYYSNQNQYHRGIGNIGNVPAWPNEVLPLRADQPYATISAEVILTEKESTICGTNGPISIGIRIQRSGQVEIISSPGNIRELFRHFDPESGIGVIDYINPLRNIHPQRVTQIDINSLTLDQQRTERIELLASNSKFARIKQYIVSEELEDLSYLHTTGEQRDSLTTLREIFAEFFSPKKLLGRTTISGEIGVPSVSGFDAFVKWITTSALRGRHEPTTLILSQYRLCVKRTPRSGQPVCA
jgi:energy-coupling factor transporter ATP-binding protein EcfA2